MKTTKEWLNELPHPLNEMAIENVRNHRESILDDECSQMSYAVNSFDWMGSPQGHDFWSEIYDYYRRKIRIESLERDMSDTMLDYYKKIEALRNLEFPHDKIQEAIRITEEHLKEKQRQIDEAVTYSTSFRKMLNEIEDGSYIARLLLDPSKVTNKEANFISMRNDMCSFLPPNREHKVNEETGRWLRDGRQEMKPGKLARKLLLNSNEYSDSYYEDFTNAIKSYISIMGDEDGNGKKITLKLVSGDDIAYYYNEERYSRLMGTGTNLWGSCMRYSKCEKYFGIFTKNPDVCSLLIALDEEGLVLGRALVWTFTTGKMGMDTIYAHESLIEAFISWAVENEAYYKDSQSCHHGEFDRLNRERVHHYAKVNLKHHDFEYYPYMDTLRYLTYDGILSTDSPDSDYKELRDTGGGYESQDRTVTLENGDECDEDEAYWLDYRNHAGERRHGYYHQDDVVHDYRGNPRLEEDCVRVRDEWYELDDDNICWVESRDAYYKAEDTVYCEHDDETRHINDCMELHDGCFAHKDDCELCAMTDEYFLLEDMSTAGDGARVSTENLEEYEESIKNNENETATA